jgi:hypothetical protein
MQRRLMKTLSILFLAASAWAQTTTITGVIKDLTVSVVTSGKVVFTLKPSVDTTISGNARFTPGPPVTCYIQNDGTLKNAIQLSACVVATNTSLTPAGTSYRVDICPSFACTSSFNFYAINASYDISTIVPTPTTGPAQNFADVFSNQSIAGNKTFTGLTTFGLTNVTTFTACGVNAFLMVGSSCYPNIAAALAATPSTGGPISTLPHFAGTISSATNLGVSNTQPIRLMLGSDTILTATNTAGYTFNLFGGGSMSCDPTGSGSGAGGVGGCVIATGNSFSGSGLLQNGTITGQEFLSLSNLFFDCRQGTQSVACINLQNIFTNSYLRDLVIEGGTGTPVNLHFTGNGGLQNSNDVLVENVWSECGGNAGCIPLKMERGGGGGPPFENAFLGGTFSDAGPGLPAARLSTTISTAFFGTNFDQSQTVLPAFEDVQLTAAAGTTFVGSGFGLLSTNYGITNDVNAGADSLVVLGGWFNNGHAINDVFNGGVQVNQIYVPLYIGAVSPVWFNAPVKHLQSETFGSNGTPLTAIQHKRITTGSIGATTRTEVLLTWANSFTDTSYTVTCNVEDSTTAAATQGLTFERLRTKSATQVGAVINNPSAGAITGTLDCTGIHD